MLAFATRIGCVAGLLCLAACENSPASGPKQHTSSNTQSDEADGGKDRDDQEDAGDHRISTGGAGKHADQPAPDSSKAGGAGGSGGHAAGKGGSSDMKDEKGGAGGEQHASGDAGRGGEGGARADDMHAGAGGADDGGDSDMGSGGAAAPSGMPMGGAPSTQDAVNVLWQWLGQTPQGMAADVIRKYLDALGSGDAPASSIDDFLHAIDDQAHCTQGISEQCLAACQVVARSCGVCLLDEDCRNELVHVCGVLTCR